MDYLTAFDISASGMSVERLRLDVTAINLANVNSTRAENGSFFKPLRVISAPSLGRTFSEYMEPFNYSLPINGVVVKEVREVNSEPRLVFDPGHPDADERGFVAYPDINPVSEMVNLMTITRAYEANVRALNAAKVMALKALEIGGTR